MLEEIITYPDYEKAKAMASTFSVILGVVGTFPVNIHTVKSLQAVVLNYEGRISEQMRVIGRLEMKHGD